MLPEFEYWKNLTSGLALLGVVGASVSGFVVSLIAAKQEKASAQQESKLQTAYTAREAAEQRIIQMIGNIDDRMTRTHYEQRSRERQILLDNLLYRYRQQLPDGPLDTEFGKTVWPLEWINSELRRIGEDFQATVFTDGEGSQTLRPFIPLPSSSAE